MANRQRICGPFACNRFDPEPANASPIPRGQMSRNSISGRKNKYASVISLQTRSLCSISFFQNSYWITMIPWTGAMMRWHSWNDNGANHRKLSIDGVRLTVSLPEIDHPFLPLPSRSTSSIFPHPDSFLRSDVLACHFLPRCQQKYRDYGPLSPRRMCINIYLCGSYLFFLFLQIFII